ncbi:MAG: hypothetical protein HS126_19185 [Anaerolineales bacterium]|nr:hypothetical protein [Anaerolineales bacterium]
MPLNKSSWGMIAGRMAIVAASLWVIYVVWLRPRPDRGTFELQCTCKCGSKYVIIKGPSNDTCETLSGGDCVDKHGHKHTLRDCAVRFAPSPTEVTPV